VGYAMAEPCARPLMCEAIDMAARRCPVGKGVTIFHSDKGRRDTSQKFLSHLKVYSIRPRWGARGSDREGARASVAQRRTEE